MSILAKTLEYRRARFLQNGLDLEQLVRQAWGHFPTQVARTVTFRDGRSTCGLKSRDNGDNGLAIHCGRFTAGQSIGTIGSVPVTDADLGERAPDPGEDFLNSDLMALIKGNHVICLNCGRNAGTLRIFLQELFRKAGLPAETQQFEIVRVGRPDKIALIQANGVSKVDLSLTIAEATGNELLDGLEQRTFWSKVTSGIGGALRSITAEDDVLEQVRLAERGSVRVSINVPKGDIQAAKEGLDHLAEEVAEDENADDFTIYLRGGATIKSDEVTVKKTVRLNAAANSVSHISAWNEMVIFMAELQEAGQLQA